MYVAPEYNSLDGGVKADSGQLLLNLHSDKGGIFGDKFEMCYLDNYVCKDCGYIENYVNDLRKIQVLEETKNWKKVN